MPDQNKMTSVTLNFQKLIKLGHSAAKTSNSDLPFSSVKIAVSVNDTSRWSELTFNTLIDYSYVNT